MRRNSCLDRFRSLPATRIALLAALLSGALQARAYAQQLTIGAYHLQKTARVSLTQSDFTYTVDLTNSGPAEQGVVASVVSADANTQITKGSVSFGSVPATSTLTSTDTFTLRQDRRFPFNPASLTWSFPAYLPAGTVTATANPQVASYTVNVPAGSSVTVNFGTDTSYNHNTSPQVATAAGPVTILVAGMLANTTYHMHAAVQFAGGFSATDVDHTFTTGTPAHVPSITATTTPGAVPQPGLEQLTMINGSLLGVAVTDLQGRVVWEYAVPNDSGGFTIEGAKLLPNGHFIFSIGRGSTFPLSGKPAAPGSIVVIREVDLAGTIINDLSVAQLNARMQAAGYNLNLLEFHHEITPLPNGHLLVLSNVLKPFTDLPGYPGVTNVLGDVVIDLDQNLQPVWVWNEFDHLDVNRHPYLFPDWTHSNAVTYSPTDGNILVSMRHQNWVVKVDYRNGAGGGGILWHLGYQGDFLLNNGVDPTDWPYAQHYPSLFTPNSAGVFSLGLMDNGNDRVLPTGVVCGSAGAPPCQYTTIPVYRIDEAAKTATLTFHQVLPPSLFSNFGGNTEQLANGNVEYDLAGVGSNSDIFEVTQTGSPQTVWHLHTSGSNAYRGYRIPSLYPGVTY